MERRTLVQRQSDVRIADPDAFARLQVAELDKQARSLMQKRKDVQRQLEEDEQELRHVEAQIRMIHERWAKLGCLVHQLSFEIRLLRGQVRSALRTNREAKGGESCIAGGVRDEHAGSAAGGSLAIFSRTWACRGDDDEQIMGTAEETMRLRTQSQTKLQKWMATSEVRAAQRYETGRSSTFKQSAPLSFTTKPTIPELSATTIGAVGGGMEAASILRYRRVFCQQGRSNAKGFSAGAMTTM